MLSVSTTRRASGRSQAVLRCSLPSRRCSTEEAGMRLNRRQILKSLSICAAGGASGLASFLSARRGYAQSQDEPKFLIVVADTKSASLIDNFLAIRASEAGANAANINAYADSE